MAGSLPTNVSNFPSGGTATVRDMSALMSSLSPYRSSASNNYNNYISNPYFNRLPRNGFSSRDMYYQAPDINWYMEALNTAYSEKPSSAGKICKVQLWRCLTSTTEELIKNFKNQTSSAYGKTNDTEILFRGALFGADMLRYIKESSIAKSSRNCTSKYRTCLRKSEIKKKEET